MLLLFLTYEVAIFLKVGVHWELTGWCDPTMTMSLVKICVELVVMQCTPKSMKHKMQHNKTFALGLRHKLATAAGPEMLAKSVWNIL